MTRDIQVSVTLAGMHSLEPGGVREACEGMERALSGGPSTYKIYCLDREFSKSEKKAPGLISVDVNRMSYDIYWGAQSEFEVPDSLVGALTRCLKPTGKLDVKASATVDRAAITLPTIAGGSLGARVSTIMFDLPPPKTAGGNADLGEVSFGGMAMPSGKNTARVTFLGRCEPEIAGIVRAVKHVLGALSDYCGECGR